MLSWQGRVPARVAVTRDAGPGAVLAGLLREKGLTACSSMVESKYNSTQGISSVVERRPPNPRQRTFEPYIPCWFPRCTTGPDGTVT